MDLVDRHRLAQRLGARAARAIQLVVAPLVARRVTTDAVLRRHLGLRTRTGRPCSAQLAVRRADLELVARALADAGDEQLPDARRAERAHRVQAAVPGVEVADHRRPRARVGAQTANADAGDAVDLAHVRAELLVELLVAALAGQVQVELAERRQERVRVAQREALAVARSRPRARSAAAARAGERALEERRPGARCVELDRLAALGAHGDRARPPGGRRGRPRRRRRGCAPEQRVRIGEVAARRWRSMSRCSIASSAAPPAGGRCRRPGCPPSRAGC